MTDRMTDERMAEIDARYDTETNLEWLRNAVHKLLQALKAEREDRNDWFYLQQVFERQLNKYIDKVKRRDQRISKLEEALKPRRH